MTSKFTKRALKVMNFAHQEAKGFDQRYIGTEHLLLGLIREKGGVGARILRRQGVNEEQVRQSAGLSIEQRRQVGDARIRKLFHRLVSHHLFRREQSEWMLLG